jgi:hypothetical protein
MDKEHIFVHLDKVKDCCGISVAILLVTDVTDCLEKCNFILGGACFCPRVHREQFGLHLWRGMLHHKVVDLLGIFTPPFLLIVGVVVLPLPFCCLNDVGRILWVLQESNGWVPELTNCLCCKRAVKLQMVFNMLGDGFEVKIEDGRRLIGSPCVVENNVFKALRGHCEQRFLWGESVAMIELQRTFDLGFLLGLGRLGSCYQICSRTST